MKRRILRKRIPNPIRKIIGAMFCHPLIHALSRIARYEPIGQFTAYPRGSEIDDLYRRTSRNAFRKTLRNNISRAFIRPNHGRYLKSNFTRTGIMKNTGLRVKTAIRQPMSQHRYSGVRPTLVSLHAISQHGVEKTGKKPTHGFTSDTGNSEGRLAGESCAAIDAAD